MNSTPPPDQNNPANHRADAVKVLQLEISRLNRENEQLKKMVQGLRDRINEVYLPNITRLRENNARLEHELARFRK